MNINQAFPSKYLKVDDLHGKNVTVTIKSVALEAIGQDKVSKPVIYFEGKDKAFVCNKTNSNTIAKLFGPDTDNWTGQKITLCPREVEFQGEMVWAIRVSLQKPALPQPKPVAPAETSGDDVAF